MHPRDAVDEYPRAWVRDLAPKQWRHRERYLNPDFIVHQQESLGRVELRAAERALRDRVNARRRLFLARRAGAKRKDELREPLRSIALELNDKYVSLSAFSENEVLAEIGEVAWTRDLADFRQK